MRGINDENSDTVTASFHGKFLDKDTKNEFLAYINASPGFINK